MVLSVLTAPQGTALSVTYDTAGSVFPNNDGRFVFHGTVDVRALAMSQKDPTLFFQQALDQGPLHLTAAGVDVEVRPAP